LAAFIGELQKTGAFYDILPKQEDATEDGMRRTTVQAMYLRPAPPKTATAAAPAPPPPPAKKGGRP
jgi:hypothetical protein